MSIIMDIIKNQKELFKARTVLSLVGVAVLAVLIYVGISLGAGPNVVWDGGGSDATCGGAVGSGNNWSCALNWSTDAVPGSDDMVVFDGTSVKNSVVDVNIDVRNLKLESGYTGTLDQKTGKTTHVSQHY